MLNQGRSKQIEEVNHTCFVTKQSVWFIWWKWTHKILMNWNCIFSWCKFFNIQCNVSFSLQLGGLRAKLEAEDGNEIDTVFMDRRNSTTYLNGNTLVWASICIWFNVIFDYNRYDLYFILMFLTLPGLLKYNVGSCNEK